MTDPVVETRENIVLNEKDDSLKTREVKNISSVYEVSGEETVGDYILVAGLSPNTIVKSIQFTNSEAITGLSASLVLLDSEKKEFTYDNEGTETTIDALASSFALSEDLTRVEKVNKSLLFTTLEKYIVEKTGRKQYKGQVWLALKVAVVPTVSDKKLLSEVNFIEKI